MDRRTFLRTAAAPAAVLAGCVEFTEATPRFGEGPQDQGPAPGDGNDGPELLREETVITDTRYPFELPAESRLIVEVDVDTGGPYSVFMSRLRRADETPPQPTPTRREYDAFVATSKRFEFEIGRAGTYYLYVTPNSAGDRATVWVWLER